MDNRQFDAAKSQRAAIETDHIEAFASGKMSRRDFVRRGTIIGLSVPLMSAVIAACSSDAKSTATTAAAGATTTAAPGVTTTVADSTTSAAPAGAIKQGGVLRIAAQKPAAPLDPVKMADLGTYSPVVTAFEYLVNFTDGKLAPMLAESWKPNKDGSVWTFTLRKGVKWHDGTAFSSADVVATMDRLAGSNLKSYITAGSAKAIDGSTVEITLKNADGQFPHQVGPYNPQSVITPADFVAGTTLDKRMTGTGAFKMTKFDPAVGATFVANTEWWGGKPYLDGIEFLFSDDIQTQISGIQGGAADAILQFPVIGSEALLNDSNLTVESIHGSGHRQLSMNTREGNFKDVRVRQAIALGLDRDAIIKTVLAGKGDIGNDHPISPIFPFFDSSLPQRKRDIAKAKQLLKDAGKEGFSPTLFFPKLLEIPQLAEVIQSQLKEIGMNVTLKQEVEVDGVEWCKVYDSKVEPAGCDGGEEFTLVDYGPRAVPDVYLLKAYATGEWNSAHFISEPFRAAVKEYQAALDLDGQKKAIATLQKIANDEVPYVIPYFYNSLTAYTKKVTGIVATGLGHYYCGKAGFLA